MQWQDCSLLHSWLMRDMMRCSRGKTRDFPRFWREAWDIFVNSANTRNTVGA